LLNPVDVAEQVASLDVICEESFICGSGSATVMRSTKPSACGARSA
jgi:hypothetical protein